MVFEMHSGAYDFCITKHGIVLKKSIYVFASELALKVNGFMQWFYMH